MSTILEELSEVLLRHIHPDFFDKGSPSSNRFYPSKRDQNQLSVDRTSVHSAATSHALYIADGKKSAAVFGLSVGEFQVEGIPCKEDPVAAKAATTTEPAQQENQAHALADYSQFDEKAQKVIAMRLRQLAVKRGVMFPS